MTDVLIVKSNLEPFRIPFFEGLHQRLARDGIRLRVAVPVRCCAHRAEEWVAPVVSREMRLSGRKLTWQRVLAHARSAQLVIAQQCAQELTNYWLLLRRRHYGYKFALWGHGKEFQRTWSTPLTEYIKRTVFRDVDYWFAYTALVANVLEESGYPSDRIAVVNNSIDSKSEAVLHAAVSWADIRALRGQLGMAQPARLVSYCGSLYQAKRVDWLIRACAEVRRSGIDLHVAIIGDGKERAQLAAASLREPWIHVAGPLCGSEKARYLAASDCMVIPGVVGLAVVDAFAHECPLVTTRTAGHGPEIDYLIDGVNGLLTEESVAGVAGGIRALLTDAELRRRLQQGCREHAARITLENMVEQFAQGVGAALHPAR